ncbi:hypothetical protein EMMF5_005666 [Cystobasidiomycetes sp. EMM_F5]
MLAVSMTLPVSAAVQTHLTANIGSSDLETVQTATTTLVDVLSSDADFSLFIRLLQRARLIPTLNRMTAATIFAPTNDAIRQHGGGSGSLMWYIENDGQVDSGTAENDHDNIQNRLRERLFYHMLNYTLQDPSRTTDSVSNISRETTLLFPTTHEQHGRPGDTPYPDPENTLLGGEGQKLVIGRREVGRDHLFSAFNITPIDSYANLIVGLDENGQNGVSVIANKGGGAKNGVVIAIERVLEPPHSLQHQLRQRSNYTEDGSGLSKFSSLLAAGLSDKLATVGHLTLFAPQDKAFDALDPLEWRYLTSGYAADDILEIASNHQSMYCDSDSQYDKVGYLDRLVAKQTGKEAQLLWPLYVSLPTLAVPALSGQPLTVENKEGHISVNGSNIVAGDILASNGVMHIVDSLLLPLGSLALTAEKYLIALNATKFVEMFRTAGLSHLLQSSPHNPTNNGSYTILAVRDDVIERLSQSPWHAIPPTGSQDLQHTLSYHILEGKWSKKHLQDGQLLKTMLRSHDLGGEQQRIAVSITDNKLGSTESREIGFGSASVVADPIEIGGSVIYLLSHILSPPDSVITTALDRGLSTFVASVYTAGLDHKFSSGAPATTYLAPTNAAFDFLGLALNYFLAPSAQEELRRLLKYHAVKGITYLDDLPFDNTHHKTLDGSDIYLDRPVNASEKVHVHGPRAGGFPANGDNRDAQIVDADLLTSTGVLHVIDQVELPPSLNMTSAKLMRGAKATTFPDLLRLANLSWIADGLPEPSQGTDVIETFGKRRRKRRQIKKELFQHSSYTILCPTDKAFTRINLQKYLNDTTSLLALVQLHIIPSAPPAKGALKDPLKFPSDGRPIALLDEAVYPTLYSTSEGGSSKYGAVSFRQAGEGEWLVGIQGARGTDGNHDAARIINHGRNTPLIRQRAGFDGDVETSSSAATMVFGGGVLLIDTVLEPYYPSWFHRWGYIVLTVVLGLVALVAISTLAWTLYMRHKLQKQHYESLRQENEED